MALELRRFKKVNHPSWTPHGFLKEFIFETKVAITYGCRKSGNHPYKDVAKFG